jgi:hypothetical protein
MVKTIFITTVMTSLVALSSAASARSPQGFFTQISPKFKFQAEADLKNGDSSFSRTDGSMDLGILYMDSGWSAGVSTSIASSFYKFSGSADKLWGDVGFASVSAPIRFQVGSAEVFMAPSVRWSYENADNGDEKGDNVSYSLFGGVSWRPLENLKIGPAAGISRGFIDNDIDVFPALILDWDVTDKVSFGTASNGGSQGPGVQLSYAQSNSLDIGIGVGMYSSEFRLSEDNSVSGGVGQDTNIPVAISIDYNPNPGISLSGYAGAAFGGELTVSDSDGNKIRSQDYETAPIVGFNLSIRF